MPADPYAEFADTDPYAEFSDVQLSLALSAAATPPPSPPSSAVPYEPIGGPRDRAAIGSWLKTNLGVPLARAGINAVTALPLMAEDLGVGSRNLIGNAYNKIVGNPATPDYELPSTTVHQAMEPYLPAPTTTSGKVAEIVNSGLLGGAAGGAGVPGLTAPTYGNVPAGFLSPRSGLTQAQQNVADTGVKLGMKLTPGQQTGNVALQQFESKLQAQPWTSGPFNSIGANNQSTLNRAWAGTSGGLGEGGASVDSTVLARAADRTGDVFKNARNANSIVAQDPAVTSRVIDGIDQEFEGLIPGSVRANPLVSRLESLTSQGAINGEQLGNLSSRLGTAANHQMTSPIGDRQLGQALYAVKDHADDLLQSTLSGADAAAYTAARQQYRALMQLSARTGNVNSSTGNVGGTSMANYLQMKDKGGYLYGRNQSDAYNATRFAQAFKPIIGDSGTATRSWGLSELPFAIPANLFSRAYLSAPGQATIRGLLGASDALNNGVSPQTLSGLLQGLSASQPSLWTTQK